MTFNVDKTSGVKGNMDPTMILFPGAIALAKAKEEGVADVGFELGELFLPMAVEMVKHAAPEELKEMKENYSLRNIIKNTREALSELESIPRGDELELLLLNSIADGMYLGATKVALMFYGNKTGPENLKSEVTEPDNLKAKNKLKDKINHQAKKLLDDLKIENLTQNNLKEKIDKIADELKNLKTLSLEEMLNKKFNAIHDEIKEGLKTATKATLKATSNGTKDLIRWWVPKMTQTSEIKGFPVQAYRMLLGNFIADAIALGVQEGAIYCLEKGNLSK